MARRHTLPDWLAELAAELTKPPAFLQVLQAPAEPSGQEATAIRPARSSPEVRASRTQQRSAASSRTPASAASTKPRTGTGVRLADTRGTASAQSENTPSEAAVLAQTPRGDDSTRAWRAAFIHADIPPDVVQAYGWKIRSARRVMNVVQVETDKGTFALKRTGIGPERVAFLYDAIAHARQHGFHRIARIVPTRRGRAFVTRDGATFYATEWLTGQPLNFASSAQVGQLAHALAEFHEATRGFRRDGWMPPAAYDLAGILEQRGEDLRSLIAVAQRKTQTDTFDKALLRMARQLRADAERAAELAASADCRAFLRKDRERAGLCHLDVIPSNFVYDPDKRVHLLDLDLAAPAPRVLDLGHLLRRALQAGGWHAEPAYACFLHYNAVRPLAPEEYVLTEALITFPHRVWRLAAARYRGQPDDAQVAELSTCERQSERRQAFLESFGKLVTRRR
ncbi:MAG: phosphotransferase [Thermoflavifilum sp.]|nr:phosphotransferase [Thermoflavifilum sp.]MCL6514209.1 phosphotransferase [Alicyclobacillus sp.]